MQKKHEQNTLVLKRFPRILFGMACLSHLGRFQKEDFGGSDAQVKTQAATSVHVKFRVEEGAVHVES